MSTSLSYRSDIDGLRAIAVLGVVLFHAGFAVSGGYVGVDVFFVISGFLITSLLKRDLLKGRFSFADFWARRIKRIVPALLVVVLATLLAGYVVLLPSDYADVSRSVLAVTALVSNIYFWKKTGYFDESAETKPLLHTWSLSLEEQFYVFIPLLLWGLFRLQRPRLIVWVLVLLGCGSFGAAVYEVRTDASAAFFLLPSRAWELIAGSLLAWARPPSTFRRRTLAGWLGLGGILVPFVVYGPSTVFPGLGAVPCVAGAVLLIWSGLDEGERRPLSLPQRILSWGPLRWCGLLSYSLYLWHWPVFAFYRYLGLWRESTQIRLGLVLVSVMLAWISYKWVEQPCRRAVVFQGRGAAIFTGGAAMAVMLLLSGLIIRDAGVPDRFGIELTSILKDATWKGVEYASPAVGGVPLGRHLDDAAASNEDFVLWGDSHGMCTARLIDSLAAEAGLSGRAFLSGGLAPVTNLWKPHSADYTKDEAMQITRRRMEHLLQSGTKHLILVARWDALVNGRLDIEVLKEKSPKESSMVIDNESMELSPDNCRDALQRQLLQMLEVLDQRGITVWCLLQVPESGQSSTASRFALRRGFPWLDRLTEQPMLQWEDARGRYEDRQRLSVEIMHNLEAPNLRVLDPTKAFFPDDGGKLKIYGDRAFYRDEDHLTLSGADHYLAGVFRPVFSTIKKAVPEKCGG
jgi:peptidoglycan/LPS O-acetylase OafA/YrhL